MKKIASVIFILFCSCGTVHLHHFKNDFVRGNKKLKEPIEINYIHNQNVDIPAEGAYFCNVPDVVEAFNKSDYYLREKSNKKNLFLGNHPLSSYKLELLEQKFEEKVSQVEVFDSEDKSMGFYNEYHVQFYVSGILTIKEDSRKVSAIYEFTSSPRQSSLFKFTVVNRPSFVNEKKVVENLMNNFSKDLYRTIRAVKKSS